VRLWFALCSVVMRWTAYVLATSPAGSMLRTGASGSNVRRPARSRLATTSSESMPVMTATSLPVAITTVMSVARVVNALAPPMRAGASVLAGLSGLPASLDLHSCSDHSRNDADLRGGYDTREVA